MTSIIGGDGSLIEANFSDKMSEVYDNMYMEIDNIKKSYKNVISGVVVDKSKYDHIFSKLMYIFDTESYEDMVSVINYLNSSYSYGPHIKFLFKRFGLNETLYNSIDSFFEKNKEVKSSNLFDDISTIGRIAKLSNIDSINKLFNKFVMLIHQTRFIDDDVKNKFSHKFRENKIVIGELRSKKELSDIMKALDLLKEMHQFMFPEIKKNYICMIQLSSEITNYVNSIKN